MSDRSGGPLFPFLKELETCNEFDNRLQISLVHSYVPHGPKNPGLRRFPSLVIRELCPTPRLPIMLGKRCAVPVLELDILMMGIRDMKTCPHLCKYSLVRIQNLGE